MQKRKKQKARTDYEIWKDYRKSIALEKEREKEHRETERGRFEGSMCHIDFAALDNGEEDGEADNDRPREWESDDGEGGEVSEVKGWRGRVSVLKKGRHRLGKANRSPPKLVVVRLLFFSRPAKDNKRTTTS